MRPLAKTLVVLVALAVSTAASSAQAGTGEYWIEDKPYHMDALTKLGRGFVNLVYAPTELYTQSFKEAERANIKGDTWLDISVGAFAGFWVGFARTFGRLGTGFFDTATFFFPSRPLMTPASPAIWLEDVPPTPAPLRSREPRAR